MRLKSIKNIEKITKSMKMIASTKLARAQKSMEMGRVYGQSANSKYASIFLIDPFINFILFLIILLLNIFLGIYQHLKPIEKVENDPAPEMILACSSDRGLCGAIHSSISKLAKKEARENQNSFIVILGDKAKPQIAREAKNKIALHFNQVGRNIPIFLDACDVVNTMIKSKLEYSKIKILYNSFRSVISYDNTTLPAYPEKVLSLADGINAFEIDDDTFENYVEFLQANQIFWALVEGHASEMAAKRTAMENATKNAGEIIIGLTMKYNRTRQAVITNELVDIITGASAL